MSRRKRPLRTIQADRTPRRRRIVIGSFAVVAVIALLFFGRGIAAWWARRMAAHDMNISAISAAEWWLAWSGWLDPKDGRTDLMQATCFRLQEQGEWRQALDSAERKGAPPGQVRQELVLGSIQAGHRVEEAENRFGALIEAGASPNEVAAAFVRGYLARDQLEKAKMVLDAWAVDYPQDAQLAYMQGVYCRESGNLVQAEAEFKSALARQPRHEPARAALAQLFEEQHRLSESLGQYVQFAIRSPTSEKATLGMVRLLRELGRLDKARAVLESLASQPDPHSSVAVEMGQIEHESGNYEEAERRFEQAGLGQRADHQPLIAAARTFALTGRFTRARQLFARADVLAGSDRRSYDLQVRLAIDPNDKEAADELERLNRLLAAASGHGEVPGADQPADGRHESPATSGPELYTFYCSACHGDSGDGKGRAARHLFPKPRDLRTGRFRLVSTLNAVPTPEDVKAVIKRGMPGTSMPAFDDLSEDQLQLLAEEVLRMRREGVREQFVNTLTEAGEEIDEDEVQLVVEISTTPEDVVRVPKIGPADPRAVARGKDDYFSLGCEKCHGEDGTGAWDMPLFDDKGRPTPPRDLVHDPFKGGQEPESIYLRVFCGMPGTPHPACYNVSKEQLIDLVHYCQSLSREPKRMLTNHQRGLEATGREYLSTLAGSAEP